VRLSLCVYICMYIYIIFPLFFAHCYIFSVATRIFEATHKACGAVPCTGNTDTREGDTVSGLSRTSPLFSGSQKEGFLAHLEMPVLRQGGTVVRKNCNLVRKSGQQAWARAAPLSESLGRHRHNFEIHKCTLYNSDFI